MRARREAPLLTRAWSTAMPLLKTAAPSEIVLDAEIAQSRPNLNTKGQGYIDDFEEVSGRPVLALAGRGGCHLACRWPRYSEETRGKLSWFNPFDGVQRTEIWPNQEDQLEAQNRNTDVLALSLRPLPDAPESWGGIMTALTSVNDFSQSKFVEIWCAVKRAFCT